MEIQEALKKSGKVEVRGWVYDVRDLSKIKFIILRDGSARIQITGVKGKTKEDVFKLMSKISRESVISVKGTLKPSKQAPNGKEVLPDSIEIISEADKKLLIDTSDHSKTELPKRLDYRFLDLHHNRIGLSNHNTKYLTFWIFLTILYGFRKTSKIKDVLLA